MGCRLSTGVRNYDDEGRSPLPPGESARSAGEGESGECISPSPGLRPPSPGAELSKIAEGYGKVLLPLGEGGPKGRMRANTTIRSGIPTLTRRFAPPSPEGRGTREKQVPDLQLV